MAIQPTTQSFHPSVFGKFYLLQKVAAGGMAEIYRAKAAGAGGFEKELAVKRILPGLSADQSFVRMLVNEAKLTVALTHPTIAQIYELGEVEGTYFISMEYVDGATLHDVLWTTQRAGRPLTIEQSIYVGLEILRGLDYAHRKTDGAGNPLGVVHCDVSPDNAMITWDGGVKLLDFGIARAQSALSNYKEGTLMGKLNYVAPEQAMGDWFDHRVDTFAVGVVLYELLTGTHPFGRVQTLEELRASRKRAVVPPSQASPHLPRLLDEFVLKSLAYDRDERFQTAKEMADGLVDFLFPTPTIAVAEHLSVTMKELYRDRIEKQQRIRANDGLNIKVLANARAQAAAKGELPRPAPLPDAVRAAGDELSSTRVFVSAFDPTGSHSLPLGAGIRRPEPTPHPRRNTRSTPYGFNSARAGRRGRRRAAGGGAAGGRGRGAPAGVLLAGGDAPALVVLSTPAGAEVRLGEATLGTTPLVLDDAPLDDEGGELVVTLADHREERRHVVPSGEVVKVEVALRSALGPLRVESEPPGARVVVDGREAGTTPLELQEVRLDRPHRFDLERRGYEPDSFILTPDDAAGGVVKRKLEERGEAAARATGAKR